MNSEISAIILAAGQSTRMGRPKMVLPWGTTTVLGQVVAAFQAAEIGEILVVTGGARKIVERMLFQLDTTCPVRAVFNPDHITGGMLSSLKTGLANLGHTVDAAVIGLGDQPQILETTIRRLCQSFTRGKPLLVIPSHHQQRGHPWLVNRMLWPEIMALPETTTIRQFIHGHSHQIEYVPADKSILHDLDTPEEYVSQRP